MKRNIIFYIIIILMFCSIFSLFYEKNEHSNLKEIKLAEVTHSPFYAPLYVAIENGYFKEEGIDLKLTLTNGADKVSAAVLSNDVHIGFAGPESAIYIYKNGEKDYLVTFAGLTKRDGQFIISREKNDNFKLSDLYGKEILVGRQGGMPSLNFRNGLSNNNINQKMIKINESVDFSSLTGSFIAGVGDYVNLFEPNASKLEKDNIGYIVASVGQLSGEMPYTAFYARKSFVANNKNIIKKFNNAINKGLDYVNTHTSKDIGKLILKQFPDNTLDEIITIVDRYKEYDTWLDNTSISEEAYRNLEKLMMNNNLLDNYVDYYSLVYDLNK